MQYVLIILIGVLAVYVQNLALKRQVKNSSFNLYFFGLLFFNTLYSVLVFFGISLHVPILGV